MASASFDMSIRVWDTATGALERVIFNPTNVLPDGTRVVLNRSGVVLISDQEQVQHLSPFIFQHDGSWVRDMRGKKLCWIPPEFRSFESIATHGSEICMGYRDGRIVLVDIPS